MNEPGTCREVFYMSHVMRKPALCLCENKGADQLGGNCAADKHLCFHIHSTISQLALSEISSLWPSSAAVQPGFVSDLIKKLKREYCFTVSHDVARIKDTTAVLFL